MKKHYHPIIHLLGKCRTVKELKQLHGLMITTSVIKNVIPCSKIIDICSNSELGDPDLTYAESVFDQMDHPSVYIWNSMIKGYCNSTNPTEALCIYTRMQQKGYSPDHFTFPFVLKVCTIVNDYDCGKCIHSRTVKSGCEVNMYVSTCLLNMYVSCADMESGLKVFEFIPKWNVVAWTSLISGFLSNDRASDAIMTFKDMESYGVEPNEMTMVNVIAACARSRDIDTGNRVHRRVHELRFDPFDPNTKFNIILATAIIDMYGKCGRLKTARDLFDKMPQRNLVTWNSLIGAYYQYGRPADALNLFIDMRITGFVPDDATLVSVIGACAHFGVLALAQCLHAYVSKTNVRKNVAVGTALIDMYGKIGDVKSAQKVFTDLEKKDVMTWTSMIVSLAMHGNGDEALHIFRRMQEEYANIAPDQITYIGVLWACSHLGLVEEGQRHFNSMINVYGIEPTIEHYGCMVDLLSRAGCLEEAERLVEKMPMLPNITIWSALLNGCEIYENVSLAKRVRSHVAQLEAHGSGVHVLLSNIYAKAGRWQEAKLARSMLKHRRIGKTLGQSSVETKLLTS